MFKANQTILIAMAFFGVFTPLFSQTIAEKKAGIGLGVSELSPEMQQFLAEINNELAARQEQLKLLQSRVMQLYQCGAPISCYQELLCHINEEKENMKILQESWREMVVQQGVEEEVYALWHQPETTLEQLVIDYGSLDYVYLISPEIADISLSVSSNIPIPRASWGEMLEQILLQNGVGIKVLNPYLRQLYLIQEDLSNLKLITSDPCDLEAFPDNARVSFVLTPEAMEIRRIWYFLEKFVNPHTTVLERIGRTILIVGEVTAVKDLLKIYRFVSAHKRDLEYKAVPLFRVDAEEMAKVLSAIFEQFVEDVDIETTVPFNDRSPAVYPPRARQEREINALHVIALPKIAQAVFLIGTREEIDKAEQIICELENQVGQARDRTIFWYHVKHSDPEEIAQVLEKIYFMMVQNRISYDDLRQLIGEQAEQQIEDRLVEAPCPPAQPVCPWPFTSFPASRCDPTRVFQPPFYQQGGYLVDPAPIVPGIPEQREYNRGRDNFIVEPKTGSLVMVVETDLVPKLKEILGKLDVPKKMVKIDVLLFEKRMRRTNSYGLNLLKIGTNASQKNISSVCWNDIGLIDCRETRPCNRGILEFFFSRKKSSSGIPAFDFAYKFLMTQDDVTINATPSVVTLNQTPAIIAILEEISIKTGVFLTTETTPAVTPQDAFTRAQYGITIEVIPTIHMADEESFFEDPQDYVTLKSDITFDTFVPSPNQQPDVTRRHITNETRIPDGQTVIIGGLRRKTARDNRESVPFLGEIPGIGKLFRITSLESDQTEMIVFLTPTIISEPEEDFRKIRHQELCKRPGDLPAFLYKLNEALEREKNRLFQGFMTILFGPPRPRFICEEGEYDGR
ncbi:MAG: type II secretion system protein GspD [Waddliaceae bacterium]